MAAHFQQGKRHYLKNDFHGICSLVAVLWDFHSLSLRDLGLGGGVGGGALVLTMIEGSAGGRGMEWNDTQA